MSCYKTRLQLHPDLEEVAQWHGGVRETMNKECLQDPLGIVQCPAHHGNAVQREGSRTAVTQLYMTY